MQFGDASTIPFRDPGTRHREGNILFKYLLRGEQGSPQNYELSIVRTEQHFHGPPHRHNFDQIRYVLEGSFGERGKLELRQGEIGYYPEGTPYRIDAGTTEVLLLQFGGASGWGFTHYDQLRSHYPKLAELGDFNDGIFRWHHPPAGQANQQDGYEALWELIHGQPIVYPQPRFRHPVLMNPQAYGWIDDNNGVQWREFGRFTERNIAIGQIQVLPGISGAVRSGPTIRLLYVLAGEGSIAGRAVHAGCAIELAAGADEPVSARTPMTVLTLDLPNFPPGSRSRAERRHAEVSA